MKILSLKQFLLMIVVCFTSNILFAVQTPMKYRFLSLADIHFDPYVSCQNVRKNCNLIQKLRMSPIENWDTILSEKNITQTYRQDTTNELLNSAFNAASLVVQKNQVDFVIILGDLLGHNFRKNYKIYANDPSLVGYQAFIEKTLSYLKLKAAKAFPNTDVYLVVGNNDSYQGDYRVSPNSEFFYDTAKMWSKLIHENKNRIQFINNFSKVGYYAVSLPAMKELKLIVLNSTLFSYKAKGNNIDRAAEIQLNWLESQLKAAKEKNQKVLIAMHIPVGIDVYATLRVKLFRLIQLWKKEYTDRFEHLLAMYSPQIAGVLAGHLHSDWFQVLTFDKAQIPVSGTPSISPIFGNNPGFKVYVYSTASKQLENFETYYNPLNGDKDWHIEYDFSKTYHTQCKKCELKDGMHMYQQQNMSSYKKFYDVSQDNKTIVTQWEPFYRCALNIISADQYSKCISD